MIRYKNIVIPVVFLFLLLISCSKTTPHPNTVVIFATAKGVKSTTINLSKGRVYKKLLIKEEGVVNDTIKLKTGLYSLLLVKDKRLAEVYLAKGADIKIDIDLANKERWISYGGDYACFNNYLFDKREVLNSDSGLQKEAYRLEKEPFQDYIQKIENRLFVLRNQCKEQSDSLLILDEQITAKRIKKFTDKYAKEHAKSQQLAVGSKSPSFKDYKNYAGGTSSLTDFKGKYVFIDVWATWCAPCKAQMPHLKKLEEEYKDANIVFVSISVDFPKDYSKWRKQVANMELGGIQLFADKAFESRFIEDYYIKNIPRFILIDPDGKVVDFDAPKPSKKEEIRALFASQSI